MGYQQNPYRILRNANESSSDNNASSNPHPECQREQRLRKVIQKGGPKSLSKQIMRTINSCNHGSLLSGGLQESTDRCINCYLRDGKAKKRAWAFVAVMQPVLAEMTTASSVPTNLVQETVNQMKLLLNGFSLHSVLRD